MNRSLALLVGLPVAALALGATACGSSDDTSSTATTEATAVTNDTTASSGSDAEFVVVIQKDLDAVGCWAGTPDGDDGPLTQAAVREFQKAKDLTVDGELGPKTQTALETAAADGTKVCTTTVTTAAAAATTSTTAAKGTGACAEVTELMVSDALPNIIDLDWHCAVSSYGFPWVGGTGSDQGVDDVAFILEPGANVAFRQFDRAHCASPPVPEALMEYCNVS